MKIDWPHRGHAYSKEEINAVVEIMSNPKIQLTQGSCVLKFEEDFMNYLGSKNAFSLMSAAHGLDIAANLIEIQKGDEVIIPAHTYCATALAFARRGAIIKWADICPDSLTVTLESISKLVTPQTKAVAVVHLYGLIKSGYFRNIRFFKKVKIYLLKIVLNHWVQI